MEKLIVTVAPTGSVPKKKNNPHVPVTPKEIIECALRCEDAGAALVHIHVRDKDENPSPDPVLIAEVVYALRDRSRLIIQVSTGGRAGTDLEGRIKRIQMRPEMASLNTGSVNFSTWSYVNPPDETEALAREMKRLGVKPEIECFDVSFVQNGIDLRDKEAIEEPLHFNFVMGVRGAMPASIDLLLHLRSSLPAGSTWTVSGVAAAQLPMCTHAILMGGHSRVGLEDNIYYKRGELATNEQLVERMVRLSRELGREVATPDEARAILNLPSRK